MKYILTLTLLMVQLVCSQEKLDFSSSFVDGLDKWVAFEKDGDGKYSFGFIYLDTFAGLTYDFKGSFTFSKEGVAKVEEFNNNFTKFRLEKNNKKVAILSNEVLTSLGVETIPNWLKTYKGDEDSESSLYAYGYLFNDWNKCKEALPYLEKGVEKFPESEKMVTELVFSYNCLKDFKKAELFLKKAKNKYPKSDYIDKELIYTLVYSGKLKETSKAIKKSLKTLPNSKFHGENIYNLMYAYYQKGDKKNFKRWLTNGEKWHKDNDYFIKNIKKMKEALKL